MCEVPYLVCSVSMIFCDAKLTRYKQGQHSIVEIIANHGLLDSDILIAHACNASSLDAELLTAAKAYVSCTPDTELQMGLGQPVCFRDDMSTISSLGIDCHSNNSSDIMSQMRLALQ